MNQILIPTRSTQTSDMLVIFCLHSKCRVTWPDLTLGPSLTLLTSHLFPCFCFHLMLLILLHLFNLASCYHFLLHVIMHSFVDLFLFFGCFEKFLVSCFLISGFGEPRLPNILSCSFFKNLFKDSCQTCLLTVSTCDMFGVLELFAIQASIFLFLGPRLEVIPDYGRNEREK